MAGLGQGSEDFVKGCADCIKADRTQRTFLTSLVTVDLPEKPWDKIAVDIKGSFNIEGGPKILFVVMDYYSK